MLRGIFVACAVLLTTAAEARFPRGTPASTPIAPAATTCDANTGSCTGQDAGTGLFTAAVCDGVTNTAPAFASFNTWAKSTTTNTNGQLIELRVTGTCYSPSVNSVIATGLKNFRLWGYGASFTGAQPALGTAGGPAGQGICSRGINEALGCSARINTVSAGATSVFINTNSFSGSLATLCARYVVGRWAVITGFDIQGGYNNPYGQPPNPHFLDFAQITSTTNCTTTGEIGLSRPLTYAYLSTWPEFNSGDGSEPDQGGPGTIYALDLNWGGEVDVRGGTFDCPGQCKAVARSTSFTDSTWLGSHCFIPTITMAFTVENVTGSSCSIEADKMVGTLTYKNTNLNRLKIQSSSIETLIWDGGSFTVFGGNNFASGFDGTPKYAYISNITIPSLKIGPYAYGVGKAATCTNCIFLTDSSQSYTTESIPYFAISSGVWSYPFTANVSAMADNGSGKVRLTVDSSAGWVAGMVTDKKNVYNCTPSCTGGVVILAVPDGTHLDTTQDFSTATFTGPGYLTNSAVVMSRWAPPGTNLLPTVFQWKASPAFQVSGVTASGNFINIATSLPGGFPTVPLNGATATTIQPIVPSWRCINCSGVPQAAGDFNLASGARPMFSYTNRTYTNTDAIPGVVQYGTINTVKFNVTDAYAGATNPMRMVYSGFAYAQNTTSITGFNWTINLRQPGLRTITNSAVTCDTGGGPVAGACSGDTIAALPTTTTYLVQTNLSKPNGSPTDDPWSLNSEFDLDQGVVP